MTEKILTVRNRAGIHARPAALIAQTANKFACEVTMIKDVTPIPQNGCRPPKRRRV